MAWREVHDREYLSTDKVVRRVPPGELCARTPFTDGTSEVHAELNRGLASVRGWPGVDDPPNAYVELVEVVDRDERRDWWPMVFRGDGLGGASLQPA